MPGIYDEVKRAERIRVRALDRNGKPIELEADGLLAVCIQHEMDHLDGKLFVDYLSELKRTRIRKKLEKERKDRRPRHSARLPRRKRSEELPCPSFSPARRSSRCRRSKRCRSPATSRRGLHAAGSSGRPRSAGRDECGQAMRAAASACRSSSRRPCAIRAAVERWRSVGRISWSSSPMD